eukprot:scaffold1388_cov390-Prasinococcus_capsulatus_cf.AAC.1
MPPPTVLSRPRSAFGLAAQAGRRSGTSAQRETCEFAPPPWWTPSLRYQLGADRGAGRARARASGIRGWHMYRMRRADLWQASVLSPTHTLARRFWGAGRTRKQLWRRERGAAATWQARAMSRRHVGKAVCDHLKRRLWRFVSCSSRAQTPTASSNALVCNENTALRGRTEPATDHEPRVGVRRRWYHSRPTAVRGLGYERSAPSGRTGLYGEDLLSSPEGWQRWAEQAFSECESLRRQLHEYGRGGGNLTSTAAVRAYDDISNTICKVLDPANFCRTSHTNKAFREHAEAVTDRLTNYINILNADDELYVALKRAQLNEDKTLTAKDRRIVEIFTLDAEDRAGIHQDSSQKKEVLELYQRKFRLEGQYLHNIHYSKPQMYLPEHKLGHLPARLRSRSELYLDEPDRRIFMVPISGADTSLVFNSDETVCRSAYVAMKSCPEANLRLLPEILSTRHSLARLLGHD